MSGDAAAEPRYARLLLGSATQLTADESLAGWGMDGEFGDGVAAAEPRYARLLPGTATQLTADESLGGWGMSGEFGDGVAAAEPRYARLLPGTATQLTADESLGGWGVDGEFGDGVALNMIASVDGRIAVGGRSAPLGSRADRVLFHALRARADAVMAGAGTIRTERYGPIIRDPQVRQHRREQGLDPQPLAVIVSRSLEIDPAVPLLADPGSRVVVLTEAPGELAASAAAVEYVRRGTLRDGLGELRARWGVRKILCEGGPTLNGALAAESLIDELFLACAPLLVGDVPGGRGLVIGGAPASPRPLELRMLLTSDSQLFAHYVAAD